MKLYLVILLVIWILVGVVYALWVYHKRNEFVVKCPQDPAMDSCSNDQGLLPKTCECTQCDIYDDCCWDKAQDIAEEMKARMACNIPFPTAYNLNNPIKYIYSIVKCSREWSGDALLRQ